MSRVLIVGAGDTELALAQDLLAAGHAVRLTTGDERALASIEELGAETMLADPDRVGTLVDALAGVTVACWLLAHAGGPAEQVRELHTNRLWALLEKVVDSPVRGFVYEAVGSVDAEVLAAGSALVRRAGATWAIPYALLETDRRDESAWRRAACEAIDGLIAGRPDPVATLAEADIT